MFINPDTTSIHLMSQRLGAAGPRTEPDVLNLASKPAQDSAQTDQAGGSSQVRAVDETLKIMAPVPSAASEALDELSIIPSHTMLAIIEAREREVDQVAEMKEAAESAPDDVAVSDKGEKTKEFMPLDGPNAPSISSTEKQAEPSEQEVRDRETPKQTSSAEQRELERSVEAIHEQEPPQVDVRS